MNRPDETAAEETLDGHLARFRAPLIGLLVSWGAPWSEAVELAQDAFAEAYLQREACRGDWRSPDFFGGWLRGIARNRFRNWVRKAKRRQVQSWNSSEHDVAEHDVAQADSQDSVDRAERANQIRDAIQSLSPRHREVVILRYYHDTPTAEIARLLGTSPRAVEGRLRQARQRLQKILEQGNRPESRGIPPCL